MDFSKLCDDTDFDELFEKVKSNAAIYNVFFANSIKEIEWQISCHIKPYILTILNFKWSLDKASPTTRYYSNNGRSYKYCYIQEEHESK